MYTRNFDVETRAISGFDLEHFAFTPKSYCYGQKGKPICPTWIGRSKVMVMPRHWNEVGVHGGLSEHQLKARNGIHFHTNEAHFKEWCHILNDTIKAKRMKKNTGLQKRTSMFIRFMNLI
jgi:hypothetical protein